MPTEDRPDGTPSIARPRRVFVFVGDTVLSGPIKGAMQLLAGLQDREGHHALVNCLTERADARLVEAEAESLRIPYTELRSGRRSYLRMLALAARLAAGRPDTLVQTHGYKQTLVGLYLRLFHRLPWICFVHGSTTENRKAICYHRLEALMQRFASRTVIVSAAQRSQVIGGLDAARVRVIHNAVDPLRPVAVGRTREATRASLGFPSSSPIVAVIGRLSPEKGVDIFLHSLKLLRQEYQSIQAVVVGDGPARAGLLRLAADLGVADAVRFTGHVPTPGDFVLASDVVVLPSRSECIPNVALEAMAFRKPVVATRVGGVPEVIDDGRTGILVPPDDPPGLAAAIRSVLINPELADELSRAGLARVQQVFSPSARLADVEGLYVELLSQHR